VTKNQDDPIGKMRQRIENIRRKNRTRNTGAGNRNIVPFARRRSDRLNTHVPQPDPRAGCFIADSRGVCIYTNREFQRLVGAARVEDTIGTAWISWTPLGYELDAARQWLHGVQSGQPFSFHTKMMPKMDAHAGSVISVVIRATPLLNVDGRLVGYAGVLALDDSAADDASDGWTDKLVSFSVAGAAFVGAALVLIHLVHTAARQIV
jgi:PAS domain-containing protein